MSVIKHVMVAVLLAGVLLQVRAGVRAALLNMHRLRTWKRFPATVYGVSNPPVVQVRVGSGREEQTLTIPRAYDAGYSPDSKVTVLENPAKPEERRLTGFFDLWNPTIMAAIISLVLIIAARLLWRAPWGAEAAWSDGGWKTAPAEIEAVTRFEVKEPAESWIANLIFGCVVGLAVGLPPFFARGEWRPWHAFWAAIGIGLFLWLLQSAVMNYSRTVR